jgi:hypothetical protein
MLYAKIQISSAVSIVGAEIIIRDHFYMLPLTALDFFENDNSLAADYCCMRDNHGVERLWLCG